MTDSFCSACGSALEPAATFCANCGQAIGVDRPATPVAAPHALPPQGAPFPGPMPPIFLRPPRNPRQMASYAAAVMILISGMFALMFGNLTLYWDAWDTDWDWETDQETTLLNVGPFFSGLMFLVAFAVSLLSAYCALRLIRYEVAVAGPVTLLIGYFATLAYESFMLVISVEILILSIVSLALLYYAIPIYSGRNAPGSHYGPGGPLPTGDMGVPAGETTDKYLEGPSTKG